MLLFVANFPSAPPDPLQHPAPYHYGMHREAKFFRASFGGFKFEKAQRDALASSTSISVSASCYDKSTPTITTEATTIKPPVPFSKWTPRAPRPVVAVMKSVDEGDDEESADENAPTNEANDESIIIPTQHDPNISALTASEMLTKACYRHVTKNYCGISNCSYSHNPGIIAAARDQQIMDLTNAKRDMQAGHQAVMKTFEKQGAKVFKRDPSTAERRPQNPAIASHISLLIQSPGSALDEHIGRKHECSQRIALLYKIILEYVSVGVKESEGHKCRT